MAERRRSRQIESSAVAAIGPVLVIAPFCLLALFVVWLVVRLVWDIPFWWLVVGYLAGAVLLFIRPVQAFVLTPLFGARRPTDEELDLIFPLWRDIAHANRLPPERYILRVLPSRGAQRLRVRRAPRRRHVLRRSPSCRAASWPACSPTS